MIYAKFAFGIFKFFKDTSLQGWKKDSQLGKVEVSHILASNQLLLFQLVNDTLKQK